MCARAAACRVQRRIPGLRRPVASRVDTAEMELLFVSLAQWSRASVYEAGGWTFESSTRRQMACIAANASKTTHGGVAQQGEHLPCKQTVAGSMPAASTTMPRWTSGEVLGPSRRRGGFDSRTGYHCLPEALRRAHASMGANRPQRLGGVGTRHRQPFEVAIAQSGRAPVCRTGCRGIEARWRRHLCAWGWPSPRGPRLQVVTLASPVRSARSAGRARGAGRRPSACTSTLVDHPQAHRPLVAEQVDAPVSEAGAARRVRSIRTEGTSLIRRGVAQR